MFENKVNVLKGVIVEDKKKVRVSFGYSFVWSLMLDF